MRKVSLPRWDWAAKSRSESKQRAWAAHQNKAPLLFASQEHQQAREDRGKAWTMPLDDEHEGSLYCMSPSACVWQCDWIQWESQWSNEYLSSSSTPRGPCTAHRPTPVLPLLSRCKVGRDGIWRAKDPSEFKNLPSCCEGDCGKTSRKIWAEHKWWWQIIVEAVKLGFLYAAQTWCTVFEYIKTSAWVWAGLDAFSGKDWKQNTPALSAAFSS